MSVFVLYPLQCPSTFPLFPSPPPPPPVLTLACLSGLLPCIPPYPVWPPSQEVAQLVDKHHGGDEEEGVRELPTPLHQRQLFDGDGRPFGWRMVVDGCR